MPLTIVSSRRIYNNTSWQTIYDWEDDFVAARHLPLEERATLQKSFFDKAHYHAAVYPYLPKAKSKHYKLYFTMVAPGEFNFFSAPNYIPIIIDAWKPDLERMKKFLRYNQYIFLGSLEAVQALNNDGMGNVHYSPVSISKKYQCLTYPHKDIDLLVYGRNHEVIWDWIRQLWDTTSLEIVTCYPNKQGDFVVTSNKKGVVGTANNRQELMLLLQRSRYCVVSSTGNDKRNTINQTYTGGFSPVTPRFLECTANYCQGLGIWYNNPDFNHFNIDSIAVKAETFEAFETTLHQPPRPDVMKPAFDTFLENHWSYRRLEEIERIVGDRSMTDDTLMFEKDYTE